MEGDAIYRDGALLAATVNTSFVDALLNVCYFVTAYDAAGNESAPSNTVCPDDDTRDPVNATAMNFINGGAATTDDINLNLEISATDNQENDSGISMYIVRHNTSGEEPATPTMSDGGWISVLNGPVFNGVVDYSAIGNYSGGETIFVWVWFKDAAGNISQSKMDDIQYTPDDDGSMVIFEEDFETGGDGWGADGGVWEAGTSVVDQDFCYEGVQCAGTVLDASYPRHTDSRFISPTIDLLTVTGDERLTWRYWQWFSWSSGDSGQVQISTDGGMTWENLGTPHTHVSRVWTRRDLDLTAYAGQTVQIGFYHIENTDAFQSSGWYLDDISVFKHTPIFSGDFEAGLGDWSADNGLWQMGPTPESTATDFCVEGDRCPGTVWDAAYPRHTRSRFISAPVELANVTGGEQLTVQFQHWFSWSSGDSGELQISTDNGASWNIVASYSNVSTVWTQAIESITAYAGQTVRIAFYHVENTDAFQGSGWFIDDIEIVKN